MGVFDLKNKQTKRNNIPGALDRFHLIRTMLKATRKLTVLGFLS